MGDLRAQISSLTKTNERLLALLERDNPSWSDKNFDTELAGQIQATRFDFDETLATSYVYRGMPAHATAGSIMSRTTTKTCWTELSGLSLAQVDNIGDILLPLYREDIATSGQWFSTLQIEPTITEEKELEHDPLEEEVLSIPPPPKNLLVTPVEEYDPSTQPEPKHIIHISLVGRSGTGKSELLQLPRWSIGICERFITRVLSDEVLLAIDDISGMQDYERLRRPCMTMGDAILFTYRIDSPESWETVQDIAAEISMDKPDRKQNPVVIFQNKLRDDVPPDERAAEEDLWMVADTEIHRAWAIRNGFECVVGDIRDHDFVYHIFESLAQRRVAALETPRNSGRRWPWRRK
jgi:hypothetical protein